MGPLLFCFKTRPAGLDSSESKKIMYTSFYDISGKSQYFVMYFSTNPPIMQTILQIMYAIVRNS